MWRTILTGKRAKLYTMSFVSPHTIIISIFQGGKYTSNFESKCLSWYVFLWRRVQILMTKAIRIAKKRNSVKF